MEVALNKIRSPRVSQALQDLLLDKREGPSTRAKAAWLLGRLRCSSALQALIETLADKDGYLRSKVVEALRVLKDRRAAEPIHALLNDEDERVRVEVAFALETLVPSTYETFLTDAQNLYVQRMNRQLTDQLNKIAQKWSMQVKK